MNVNPPSVYIFGEVLFDCFPDEEPKLGGAPFNVAWHLQAFGLSPQFISAVGDDELGQRIRNEMTAWGLSTKHLQLDPVHATGQVSVTFHEGEPQYDIVLDSAYDHLEPAELPHPEDPHLFYHGTLASRCVGSRECLEKLRSASGQKTFVDVNLRNPWWEKESVIEQIYAAHCLKLNQDELALLSETDLSQASIEECMQIAKDFKLKNNIANLILTRGAEGACFIDEEGQDLHPSPPASVAEVVDTVGAGDAFSAVVILGLIYSWDWSTTLERAQDFAGFIVGQRGATSNNASVYQDFKCLWGIL